MKSRDKAHKTSKLYACTNRDLVPRQNVERRFNRDRSLVSIFREPQFRIFDRLHTSSRNKLWHGSRVFEFLRTFFAIIIVQRWISSVKVVREVSLWSVEMWRVDDSLLEVEHPLVILSPEKHRPWLIQVTYLTYPTLTSKCSEDAIIVRYVHTCSESEREMLICRSTLQINSSWVNNFLFRKLFRLVL